LCFGGGKAEFLQDLRENITVGNVHLHDSFINLRRGREEHSSILRKETNQIKDNIAAAVRILIMDKGYKGAFILEFPDPAGTLLIPERKALERLLGGLKSSSPFNHVDMPLFIIADSFSPLSLQPNAPTAQAQKRKQLHLSSIFNGVLEGDGREGVYRPLAIYHRPVHNSSPLALVVSSEFRVVSLALITYNSKPIADNSASPSAQAQFPPNPISSSALEGGGPSNIKVRNTKPLALSSSSVRLVTGSASEPPCRIEDESMILAKEILLCAFSDISVNPEQVILQEILSGRIGPRFLPVELHLGSQEISLLSGNQDILPKRKECLIHSLSIKFQLNHEYYSKVISSVDALQITRAMLKFFSQNKPY
jgi:hypothetical protein